MLLLCMFDIKSLWVYRCETLSFVVFQFSTECISSSAWWGHLLFISQHAVEKSDEITSPKKADLTELYHPLDFGDAISS